MEASIAVARDPVTEACKILSGAFPPRSYPGIEEEQVKFLMALDERTRAILTLALVAMEKGETLSWEEGLALLRTALGIGKKRGRDASELRRRDICIIDAVDHISKEFDLRPTGTDATRTMTACGVVAQACGRLGGNLTEAAVAKIWQKRHLGLSAFLGNK